jgi:hypothetical protein
MFRWISRFWKKFRRRKKLKGIVLVEGMSALPYRLDGKLYVVGKRMPKWAVLDCPCRCGDRIDVNLMQNRTPHWTLIIQDDRASLNPSLWVPKERCGSHFFIRSNVFLWV